MVRSKIFMLQTWTRAWQCSPRWASRMVPAPEETVMKRAEPTRLLQDTGLGGCREKRGAFPATGKNSSEGTDTFLSLQRTIRIASFIMNFLAATLFGCSDHCSDNNHDERTRSAPRIETTDAGLLDVVAQAQLAYGRGDRSIDFDGDGRKEWSRSADGKSATADVNGDGETELRWYYDKDFAKFAVDPEGDDDFEYSLNIQRSPGSPVGRVWEDTNGNDIVDQLTTYTYDINKASVTIVTEDDKDEDRQFVVVRTRHASLRQYQTRVAAFDAKFVGCTNEAQSKIKAALANAITEGGHCLTSINTRLGYRYLSTLGSSSVTFECKNLASSIPGTIKCGEADHFAWLCPWEPLKQCTISIAINPDEACLTDGTVFHELLHYILPEHTKEGTAATDPDDRIYGCEHACFGDKSSSNKSRCAGYIGGGASGKNGASGSGSRCLVCRCTGKTYTDFSACSAECPATIPCAFGNCVSCP